MKQYTFILPMLESKYWVKKRLFNPGPIPNKFQSAHLPRPALQINPLMVMTRILCWSCDPTHDWHADDQYQLQNPISGKPIECCRTTSRVTSRIGQR
eukprot:3203251-Rhodomonas_salina.5